MDDETNENATENDTYVFLDFNGKISSDIFGKEVFLKIANLHKKDPLIQVNDNVFKGTYDYSTGTNLFFEEIEDTPPTVDAFEKQTPIHLKHILSETKVINFKPVKIPQRKVAIPNEVTHINFNLDWEYNKLLEKFENGTLHIDDIVKKESQGQLTKEDVEETNNDDSNANEEMQVEQGSVEQTEDNGQQQEQNALENIVPIKILEADYEKLNILARRPVKRAVSPELVAKCEKKYEEAYEYHNIERQILQPSDAFRTEIVTDINEGTLSDCVDIDRCVLHGIIPPSTLFPRILSKKEKEKVLTLENFDNLSLAARYYVLYNHVQDMEKSIATLPKVMLKKKDEFGRTPKQTLEIYKKLCDAIRNRLREIKYSLNCEAEEGNNKENVEGTKDDLG